MKKLIAMFAAAAMAFGLYAEEKQLGTFTESSVEFSSEELGDYNWKAEDDQEEYRWFSASDDITATIVEDADESMNVLSLSTGSEKLFRTAATVDWSAVTPEMDSVLVQDPEDESAPRWGITFQQRIKFTGFEEAQTNLADGAKFALWALETEEEGTFGEDGYVAPSTNLYVTCGKIESTEDYAPAKDPVAVQLNVSELANFDPYAWHNVTITLIQACAWGDTFEEADKIPGFIVKIDNKIVGAISDETLFPEDADFVSDKVAALAAANKVFPSFVKYASDMKLTVKGVGYQGIGSLASVDVIADLNYEPTQTVPVTVEPIEGAIIVVTDADGNVVDLSEDGFYNVAPGAFKVTYTAADGYVLKNAPIVKDYDTDDGDQEIDDSATVKPQQKTGFAVIIAGGSDTNYYPTLAAAFGAAQNGQTVMLFENAVLAEWIGVNKELTFDLNGQKVTAAVPFAANQDALFAVNRGGKLTITDGATGGEIDSGAVMCAIKMTQNQAKDYAAEYTDANKAILFVNGGTIKGFNYAIAGNGNAGRGNTEITISGGTLIASDEGVNLLDKCSCAIYNPSENSTLTITGGTIVGYDSAVEIRAGSLTVTGGSLTAKNETYAVKGNGNGPTVTGAALAVSQHTTEKELGATVSEVTGATLTGTKAVAVVNPQLNTTDNVEVELGQATYNGGLAFEADGNAVVTDNNSGLAAPAGYTWEEGILTAYVATVASGSDTFSFTTSAAALTKVLELEADAGNFPIVATALVADLEVVGPNGVKIVLAKDETITITANSWVFSGGATISDGPIALAAGATFKVYGKLDKSLFLPPTDYEVTETDAGDGWWIYSAAKSEPPAANVAKIGNVEYATLGAAIAALEGTGDETIELLANYTAADTENLWFTKSATLDLGDFTLTVPAAIASEEGKFGVAADAELTFKNGEIVMLGNGGRGVNIKGGVLNIYCTITRESTATSSPIVDIYDGGTVNVYDGAVLNSYGHVFNMKKASPNGQFLNVYGGTINSLGSNAAYSVIYVCYGGINANLNIVGGTFNIGNSSLCYTQGYSPVFTGLLTDASEAKFDKPQGKSSQHYLVADGYEFVQGADEYYTIAKIPSFTVTFSQNNEPIVGADKTVLRDTVLKAEDLPTVEGGEWDVNPVGAIITSNTNFNYTVKAGPDWPSDWPADVSPEMKEAFAKWAEGKGTLDFNQKAVQDAFLMNTEVGAVPELKIESISVEGTTATIVVSATGKDLEKGINGVLYIDAANDLTNWTTTEVETTADFTDGKATFTVDAAKFMKAGVGFKAPVVE